VMMKMPLRQAEDLSSATREHDDRSLSVQWEQRSMQGVYLSLSNKLHLFLFQQSAHVLNVLDGDCLWWHGHYLLLNSMITWCQGEIHHPNIPWFSACTIHFKVYLNIWTF
jgi:hypothetical protein